jgi:hypothetical protein
MGIIKKKKRERKRKEEEEEEHPESTFKMFIIVFST